MKKNFLICGLDRLGKDTLIDGLQQELGYYQVIHRSRPPALRALDNSAERYQRACFEQDMQLIRTADHEGLHFIWNRAWLGEAVYAPMYRGYDGNYVFDLEKQMEMNKLARTRLILLTEDFSRSCHFKDDGLSFDPQRREQEQQLFISAWTRSCVVDKRMISVTDPATGLFKSREQILELAVN